MVDTPIKSDTKLGPRMLLEDESQYWGDHTIGPKIMENAKKYSTAPWRNIKLRYCAKLVHCVNLYEESRTIFSFAICAIRKHFLFFYVFKFFFTDRAIKNIFFVMFLTYMCNTNYVRAFYPVRAAPKLFFFEVGAKKVHFLHLYGFNYYVQ